MAHWLLKSEPEVFGYDDLVAVRREPWDGIRNYQSRNHLRAMRTGDEAIFYHSSTNPPGAAGICKIVKEAEPDPTQFDPTAKYYDPASKPEDPRWDIVTVAPVRKLRRSCPSTSCAPCRNWPGHGCWQRATGSPCCR